VPVKQKYSGPPELLAAQDAICKIPLSTLSLKESLASAYNTNDRAILGCLESVERLGLVGISGLHAVRYLKSVLQSHREGIYPPRLCSYTRPMLDALEPEDNGKKSDLPSVGSSSSLQINSTKKRKTTSRK
jgi:hypothetical protein